VKIISSDKKKESYLDHVRGGFAQRRERNVSRKATPVIVPDLEGKELLQERALGAGDFEHDIVLGVRSLGTSKRRWEGRRELHYF